MKLTFRLPTFEYMLDTICAPAQEGTKHSGGFYPDTLFQFYPCLDKRELQSMDEAARREYLGEVLGDVYRAGERQLGDTAAQWQVYWDRNSGGVCAAFEEIFDMPLERELRRLTCNITLDPRCPHDLERRSFDIFHMNSARGAMGLALREIMRIVWFMKWQARFGDDPADYRSPNLKWVFSEMVPESILSHPELAKHNPYRGRSCAECFYAMRVDGVPILELLDRLYRENDIVGFMEKGFRLCIANEKIIRNVIC